MRLVISCRILMSRMRVFQEEGGSSQMTAVKRNTEKWPLDLVTLVRVVW